MTKKLDIKIDVKFYRESIFGIHSGVRRFTKKINAMWQNFVEKKQTFIGSTDEFGLGSSVWESLVQRLLERDCDL